MAITSRMTMALAAWVGLCTLISGTLCVKMMTGQVSHEELRARMVARDIASGIAGRPAVRDARVLESMRTVPRHEFVRPEMVKRAYDDMPLPIAHGQTISQPYIVAYMTELLQVKDDDIVLEVGTGSGYQAAVLAELVKQVYTVELVKPLADEARERLKRLRYENIEVRAGDGYAGWPERAPFDAIMVTAAPEEIPPPLIEQLKPGGRLVIPVGHAYAAQDLQVLEKKEDGTVRVRGVMPVGFVPFLREEETGAARE